VSERTSKEAAVSETSSSNLPETQLGRQRGRKIRDLGPTIVTDEAMKKVSPRVLDFTVLDLQDIADEISGLDSFNPKAKSVSAKDLQDIETIFNGAKGRGIQSRGGVQGEVQPEIFDNWSCCCCTPCCCCAATEIDPFQEPAAEVFP
jgi:hypothetical protein